MVEMNIAMRIMIRTFVLALIGSLLFTSCVSQKKYQEAVEAKASLERYQAESDSLEQVADGLENELRNVEGLYQRSLHENEQYRAASKSLFASFQELQEKYQNLITNREDLLSTSSYEKQGLLQQLSAYQEEIDKKERYLRNLEWDLAQKEERLNRMQQQDLQGDLAAREQRIQQLQAQLQQKDAILQQIQEKITRATSSLSQSDFSVTEKRGKLYLSMSQNLLFRSGSSKLDREGRQALQQVASALKNNPDIDITVEGHTDTDGSASENWILSTERAVTVVQELVDNGVDPHRLTAAGRAFYQPVASNSTAAGKALNRRTEIIISPKLDELMDLMD
jgi:chemotaxis protein MotB